MPRDSQGGTPTKNNATGASATDQAHGSNGGGAPATLVDRLSRSFLKPASPRPKYVEPPPATTDAERRERIRSVDPIERKWAYAGLVLAFITGVGLCIARAASNPYVTQRQKITGFSGHVAQIFHPGGAYETVHVSTRNTWILYGVLLAVLSLGGLLANRYRKRSILTFCIIILGFAFTLFFTPLGLALIVLGGWLLVRAWRTQRFGTPSAKGAAEASRHRPAAGSSGGSFLDRLLGRQPAGAGGVSAGRGTARGSTTAKGKATTTAGGGRAPEANKRYTPKAAPKSEANKRYTPKSPPKKPAR